MQKVFIKSNILVGTLALVVALPILVVGSAWLIPASELWSHFAQTLLPELVTSTLILLAGVAIGVSIFGYHSGLLSCYGRFSGTSLVGVGLIFAFCYAGIRDGFWFILVCLIIQAMCKSG